MRCHHLWELPRSLPHRVTNVQHLASANVYSHREKKNQGKKSAEKHRFDTGIKKELHTLLRTKGERLNKIDLCVKLNQADTLFLWYCMKYLVKSDQIRLRNDALNCIWEINEVRLMPSLFLCVACQVMELGSDMPYVRPHN